ncbi:MAG: M57 family metalloprotease, partial [Sediminibacterium sp.]
MKKPLFSTFFLSVLSILFFSSCHKQDRLEFNSIDINKIKAMGFNTSSIIRFKEYYIVENDILIDGNNLNGLGMSKVSQTSNSTLRPNQAITNQPIVNKLSISISIDASVSSDWVTAITNAIQLWNSIPNFKLNFYLSSNSNSDIQISYSSIPGDEIAAGLFSNSGNVGNAIFIDPSKSTIDAGHRQLIITHELGHTIGFRHTDLVSEGGQYLQIAGTYPSNNTWPNPDPISIMNRMSNQTNFLGRNFSRFDKIAIRNTYPLDEFQLAFYRYNNVGKHLYSTNWNELTTGNFGWSYEWAEGYVFSIARPGMSNIYRYWLPSQNDYFYTTNYNELGNGKWGYQYQGIIGFAPTTQISGSVPLYQFY